MEKHRDIYYMVSAVKTTWPQAAQFCASKSMALAKADTADDVKSILSYLGKH